MADHCGLHGWPIGPSADDRCIECLGYQEHPTGRPLTTTEAANRAAVAMDLADALATLPNGTNGHVVAGMPERSWELAAEAAGCEPGYVPSPATRITVVRLLHRRAARKRTGTDPFAGFPTNGA